ncbi:unnamed protein product [Fraxinus pennsylvanica]|uniref:Nucleotide-diphospho-sugar transferase domain-containing protein n=1 Tax=Fraxinus pennsylvanica TaxID=56036 RepID=A0AAD2E7P0_9LAMI|nr:unnamed protein product [Fraxinus pennsylvanica]
MAVGRREKNSQSSIRGSHIAIAIGIGVVAGCIFAFFFPNGFFSSDPPTQTQVRRLTKSSLEDDLSSCESPEKLNMLKTDIMKLSEKNGELKKQVRELNEKLRLAEQGKDHAQEQFMVLSEPHKAGPFGTVKALRTNPTVLPDEGVNPRLAKLLAEVAVGKELIVALANSNVIAMLEVWFTSIKKVGIPNYLVVALDDAIVDFCKSNDVPVYKRDPDEVIDNVGKIGGNHAVSGLKFRILREFLQLGYSVLLSDVDIVYLQNPFDHLHRDSDVESMTDGHNNMPSYGYNDVFDEPAMAWARNIPINIGKRVILLTSMHGHLHRSFFPEKVERRSSSWRDGPQDGGSEEKNPFGKKKAKMHPATTPIPIAMAICDPRIDD